MSSTAQTLNQLTQNGVTPGVTSPLDFTPKYDGSVIDSNKSTDPAVAIDRFHEQQRLCTNPIYKTLLENIKQFIADMGHRAPVIFISYAWPSEELCPEEYWIQDFVQRFAEDLMHVGIGVLLDNFQSGPGKSLSGFMGAIQQADAILVISTETMGLKLQIPESGVNYELSEIRKSAKSIIMPLLLTAQNTWARNVPEAYKSIARDFAEGSFYKNGYFKTLMSVISQLYGCGLDFIVSPPLVY